MPVGPEESTESNTFGDRTVYSFKLFAVQVITNFIPPYYHC